MGQSKAVPRNVGTCDGDKDDLSQLSTNLLPETNEEPPETEKEVDLRKEPPVAKCRIRRPPRRKNEIRVATNLVKTQGETLSRTEVPGKEKFD